MKKAVLSLFVASGLLAIGTGMSSCKDAVKDLFNEFITSPMEVPFQIEMIPDANTGFISLDSAQVEYDLDQIIRDHTEGAFGIDDADHVYIQDMRLVLNDATSTSNFANFTGVNVAITSNGASSVVSAGTASDIPDTYDTDLDIPVDQSIEMKEYLRNNTIYYLLYGSNRRATDKVLHGTAYVRFLIQ
jgi:hypothetical protein